MRIGAHESIAGGLHHAFERAAADGAEALQIFTRSSRQWAAKALSDSDVAVFRAAHAASGLPVIVHDSYLINLGSEPGEIREKSLAAFHDELARCEQLGLPWLVAHPGAHADEARGLALIAEGISEALRATRTAGVLLEITAGQGSSLGYRFEHLATLLGKLGTERVGVCLDTCHLVAAGYDLTTPGGYEQTMEACERLVGLRHVKAIHLNDAKKGVGSRVDRHEHIGDGALGVATFARLLADPRFGDIPAVLETPEGRWAAEIALLKGLRDGAATATAEPPGARVADPDGLATPRLSGQSSSTVEGTRVKARPAAGGNRRPGGR